jgi:hypothetical protein
MNPRKVTNRLTENDTKVIRNVKCNIMYSGVDYVSLQYFLSPPPAAFHLGFQTSETMPIVHVQRYGALPVSNDTDTEMK